MLEFDKLEQKLKEAAEKIAKQTSSDELTDKQRQLINFGVAKNFTMPVYKAQNFVGHGQITPYGAMKQYFMEIQGRENAIMNVEYEINKIELAIDEFQHNIDNTENEFEKRRNKIELDYAKRKRDGFYLQLKGQREERKMYLQLIEELDKSEYGILEDGTKLIDAFDDSKKIENLERDYWIKRLGKQAAMDMIAYGKVGVGNMDSIAMMSYEEQEKTIQLAGDVFVWNENRLRNLVSKSNENYKLGKPSELTDQLRISVQKQNKDKE